MIRYINNEESEVLTYILRFQEEISLSWFEKIIIDSDATECLQVIWKVLFILCENSELLVRESVMRTIGSILLYIAPFFPVFIVNSFLGEIQNVKHEENISLAIIAVFCHLSNLVAPVHEKDFFSALPIFEHFGPHIEVHLKNLPHLFSILKISNSDFVLVILRTILNSFCMKVSMSVINAAYSLVIKFPCIMNNEIVKNAQYSSVVVGVFSLLSKDEARINHFDNEIIRYVSYLASESIRSQNNSLDFENSCNLLAHLLIYRRNSIIPHDELLNILINEKYKLFSLSLLNEFSQLEICSSDGINVQMAKIEAMGFILARNEHSSIKDIEQLFKCKDYDGERYTVFMKSLAVFFSRARLPLEPSINENCRSIINDVFRKSNTNWVQKSAQCQMLSSIPRELGIQLNPLFEEKIIVFFVDMCFFQHEKLFSQAIKSLKQVIRYDFVRIIISKVLSQDMFDNFIFCRSLEIINEIGNELGFESFWSLENLFIESFSFCSSIRSAGHFYHFLNSIPFRYHQHIMERAVDLSSKIFSSYTNKELTPLINVLSSNIPSMNSISNIDILGYDYGNMSYYIPVLKSCLRYISRSPIKDDNLIIQALVMLKPFPEESLMILSKIVNPSSSYFSKCTERIIELMLISPGTFISSLCAKTLHMIQSKEIKGFQIVKNIIESGYVRNGRDLSNFYEFLSDEDPSIAAKICMSAIGNIDMTNAILADFLTKGSFQRFTIKYDLSTLLKTISYSQWPLFDQEFFEFSTKFAKDIHNIQIDDCDLSSYHIIFASKNPHCFSASSLEKIAKVNKTLFDKAFMPPKPCFSICSHIADTRASIVPLFFSKDIIESVPLVNSFLTYSSIKLTRDTTKSIIDVIINNEVLIIPYIKYCTRNKIEIVNKFLESVRINDEVLYEYSLYSQRVSSKSKSAKSFYKTILKDFPNPIEYCRSNIKAKSLSIYAPIPSLETFFSSVRLSKDSLYNLLYFLEYASVPIEQLCNVTCRFMELLTGQTPIRKIILVLRLLVLTLSQETISSCNMVGIRSLMSIFRNIFLNFINLDCPSFHLELFRVFFHLSRFETEFQLYPSIINPYCSIWGNTNFSVSFLCAYTDMSTININSFKYFMQSGIPSSYLRCLRAISTFLKTKKGLEFYDSIYWSIAEGYNIIESNLIINNQLKCFVQENYQLISTLKNSTRYLIPFIESLKLDNDNQQIDYLGLLNQFFTCGEPLSYPYFKEFLSQTTPIKAGYYLIDLEKQTKCHFFSLYLFIVRSIREMNPEEKRMFIMLTKSQTINKMKNKQRSQSLALLLEDTTVSRIRGAEIASKIIS